LSSRSTRGVSCARNSCNWRTLGSRRRCGKWAKRRHARCSGKDAQSRFVERTGVSKRSSIVRSNCAALNSARRPDPRCRGSVAQTASSGTNGESSSSSATEPVMGRGMPQKSPKNRAGAGGKSPCAIFGRNYLPQREFLRLS